MNASARECNPQRVNIHANLRMSCATRGKGANQDVVTRLRLGMAQRRIGEQADFFDRLQFQGRAKLRAPRRLPASSSLRHLLS
jgi:hypothetical protein